MRNRSVGINILKSIALQATGISFVLMMEHDLVSHGYKDYSFHPRFNQPCQGGELRKYEKTHPGRCTQPHNHKPGDLWNPFPEGKVAAVAFPLYGPSHTKNFLTKVFHKDSPFKKAFGTVDNVVLLENEKGNPYGFIVGVKDLKIDPTLMVHMVWCLKDSSDSQIDLLMSNGYSIDEALAFMMCNGFQTGIVGSTHAYHHSTPFSARRYFEGKPNDLSGGYYEDGIDYNRTYVADVFKGKAADGAIKWNLALNAALQASGEKPTVEQPYGGDKTWTPEQIMKAGKKVFEDALKNEKEVVEEPYQYRNAQGMVLDTPVIGEVKISVKKKVA